MPGLSRRKKSFVASSMITASQVTSTAADPTVQRSRRDCSPGRARMLTYKPTQYSVDTTDWTIVRNRMSVIRCLFLRCSFVGRRPEQGGEWPEWRQRNVFVIDEVRLSQWQTVHDGLRVSHGSRRKDEHHASPVAPL